MTNDDTYDITKKAVIRTEHAIDAILAIPGGDTRASLTRSTLCAGVYATLAEQADFDDSPADRRTC